MDINVNNLKTRLAAGIIVCIVALIQVWIVSAGRITTWPVQTTYYDMLGDAFLHGQTSLLVQPHPYMSLLSDPYNPDINYPYRLHDALYYHGKYYFYWGPVPALLLAPVKWISGANSISDAYLVFAFTFGILVFSALLIVALWRRFFIDMEWWTVVPGILVAGLGTPIPFLLGRAAVYETAIAAGQCFLIGGLYWAFTALESGRPVKWRLMLAGLCWTFAVGSRASLAPAVILLSLLVAWKIYEERRGESSIRPLIPASLVFVAPLLIGAIGLGLYNYVRFGSWSEIGLRYQLAGINMSAMADTHLTSTEHVLPSMYSYLLRPVQLEPVFPFVQALSGKDPRAYPGYISRSPYYFESEPVAGILFVLPFVWLAVIPLVLPAFSWWKIRVARKTKRDSEQIAYPLLWITLCLFGASVSAMFPVLLIAGSTMRYLADLTPALVLLATVGAWQGYAALRSRPWARKFFVFSVYGVALISIMFGILLGVTSYFGHFKIHNPALFEKLRSLTAQESGRT